MNLTCLGTITDNWKFKPESDAHLKNIFGSFQIGDRVQLEVKKFTKKRSNKQNAFYFGYVVPTFYNYLKELGGYTGVNCPYDVHENILALQFLRSVKLNPVTGIEYEFTKSTTELSTIEFNEFVENCIAWIAEITEYKLKINFPNES